jgi:hypothetical protein
VKAYLPAIEDPSNKPEGLLSTIDLFIYLGEKSYTKMEIWEDVPGSKGFGPRDSDPPADLLLCKLLWRAKRDSENFLPKKQAARIKKSIDYLAKFSINTYFTESYS